MKLVLYKEYNRNKMLLMLLLQLVLIGLNAIFACAEIAVISINDAKLEKMSSEGNKSAAKLLKLKGEPARFLATIQVAITLSGFLGSAFAADNFSEPLVDLILKTGIPISKATLDTIAVIVITLILSYLTLVLGELVPKRLAMRNSEKLALKMAGMVYAISKIFKPLVSLLTVSTNGVLRLFGVNPNEEERDEASEEDIRIMIDASSKAGEIEDEERELIDNVFNFNDINVGEISTHRKKMSVVWSDETLEEWDKTIREGDFNYYPICEENLDNVSGILNVKEYYKIKNPTMDEVREKAVEKPYFIPAKAKADAVFKDLKQKDCPLAVVVDEFGGVVGIITVQDLVEELVGTMGEGEDEQKQESN